MKNFALGLFNFITSLIMWIPFWAIRKYYLKMFLGHLGKDAFISRNVDIRKPKNIFIGDYSVINKRVLLDGRGGILTIEDNVDIAQESNIWTLTHDINDAFHSAIGFPTKICSHSWIGARSTILPGVTIERGAVVGTNSVVTKDVESKNIMAGIPAKVIGKRNNELKYQFKYKPWFE